MKKYISLFTDYGFKKVFGEEPNKDLLIRFLKSLLPVKHQIVDFESMARQIRAALGQALRKPFPNESPAGLWRAAGPARGRRG
ncbi:MAG: PD-(D/E)XK nuclease family transposase [Cyanobium sp.]